IDSRARTSKAERICLDLFYESGERLSIGTVTRGAIGHSEMIAKWADAILYLSEGVEEVYLDVTPTSAVKWDQHRIIFTPFLHDNRAYRFLCCSVRGVGGLISNVDARFGVGVPILLTVRLSETSIFLVESLRSESGLVNLYFMGTWVSTGEGLFVKLSKAVDRIASKQQIKKAGDIGANSRFR
ncbi:hypothetical protein EJ02DRAFT_490116, partial [Clathrospora elynae]